LMLTLVKFVCLTPSNDKVIQKGTLLFVDMLDFVSSVLIMNSYTLTSDCSNDRSSLLSSSPCFSNNNNDE
jgi:hypothetical protein